MLREKVAKLAKLLLAGATMALCVVAVNPAVQVQAGMLEESEPNGSRATANTLPLNTWIRGAADVSNDEDWYQITIPSGKGYSQLEIKPSLDNPYDGARWKVQLFDVNWHEMSEFTSQSFEDYKIGLISGKYYVKVSKWNGTGLEGTYNLIAHYTKSDEWEKERSYEDRSNSPANANLVYINKRYTGTMYCGGDVDYYRVKLNGTNKVSLKFTIDDSVSNPGTWRIEFSEYNSRKPLASYNLSTNETITIPKCAGDMLVKISNWSSTLGQIYHIQASVKTNTIATPSATTITTAKAGKRQATISWKKAKNATGYYVYRSTNSRSGYKKIATVTGRTSYTDKKSLKSKKTYYYKVVSIRKSGSKVLTAKSSAYKAVRVK